MTDEEKLKALDPKNPFTQAIKGLGEYPGSRAAKVLRAERGRY